MGHDGMLYSLPSRDLIADSVEYMVNAHRADALVCISNCDKVTPGMLLAAMRLNIPTIFVSGGPMEAGDVDGKKVDLVDIMVHSADESDTDNYISRLERGGCPTCGSCSGMFTANSMNSLVEAIGLGLPGNGTIVATHVMRRNLFCRAAEIIVENTWKYYRDGDESVLPRSIASRTSMLNAMSLDIAMGGSTNTVLHLLAVAAEAGADFTIDDIDRLSRQVPVLCKVAPNSTYHIEDVNRAGGIPTILYQLAQQGLVDTSTMRVDGLTLGEMLEKYAVGTDAGGETRKQWHAPLPEYAPPRRSAKASIIRSSTPTAPRDAYATLHTPTTATAASPCFTETLPAMDAWSRLPASTRRFSGSPVRRECSRARTTPWMPSSTTA